MSMEEEAEEVQEAEAEEQEQEQTEDTQAVETEARSMGWVPKDEFRGPETDWRDAKEFVDRGKNVLPIVNSLLKKERAKTSNLEAKIEKMGSDFESKFTRLSQMSDLALQKQKEQLETQFGALKRQAVQSGDEEAYDKAEAAEKEALADLEAKAAPPKQEPKKQQTQLPSGYPEWIEAVGFDRWTPAMRALASERENELITESPAMPVSDRLDDVLETVKSKFPEKFGKKSAGNSTSKVTGGSRGGGNGSQTAYSKLPKEAKAQADKEVELYLESGETAEKDAMKAKERWAKVYWDQPGA